MRPTTSGQATKSGERRVHTLVTGASGFVGRHLVQILRDQGDEVTAWGLGEVNSGTTAVDMRNMDVVSAQDLRDIEAVIHLAGLAQVSASFGQAAEYVSSNATMEINLMESLLAQHSSPRVLIVSTGGVYAGGSALLTETSPTRPANPYVVSKLTQELLAAYYLERGLDVMIARPFNHIGPGQRPGYLVADIASQLAALERNGGGRLSVGDLSTKRDFTDVRDVAAAYLALISAGHRGETYNVASGATLSGEEILHGLLDLVSVPIEVSHSPALRRPTDTIEVRASNEKLRAHTGWKPTIALPVTLADTLAYWREHSSEA